MAHQSWISESCRTDAQEIFTRALNERAVGFGYPPCASNEMKGRAPARSPADLLRANRRVMVLNWITFDLLDDGEIAVAWAEWDSPGIDLAELLVELKAFIARRRWQPRGYWPEMIGGVELLALREQPQPTEKFVPTSRGR
ncbi:MAG: hypothetical protein ACYDCI_00385 [Candidatus Limnocylindrales bacterium]